MKACFDGVDNNFVDQADGTVDSYSVRCIGPYYWDQVVVENTGCWEVVRDILAVGIEQGHSEDIHVEGKSYW